MNWQDMAIWTSWHVLCTHLTSEFIYFSGAYFSFAQIPSFAITMREIIPSCPIICIVKLT